MKKRVSTSSQYFISILIVSAVAAIGYLFKDIIGYQSVALLLLLGVSVLAMLFEIKPVLLASFMSALIWDYFFIPPRFTLTVSSGEDLLLLLMYFAIALVNAVLTYKLRQIEKQAQQKEEKEKTITLYNALLNSLSHELRTPIATIIGATDTLKENNPGLTEKNKTELIEEISKASIRLDRQVGNLLNMSRLQSGFIQLRMDWCDINELVYSVVNKLEKDKQKHEIRINLKAQLPLVKIDSGLTEQALYNILNNAVIYTPQHSVIEISAEVKSEMEEEKSTGIDKINRYLVMKIADDGPGFPIDEIKKVFNRFYRLQNTKTGGTGLGLSIAKGFVEAHKGTIELKNRAQQGAEFTITIPVETSNLNGLT